MSPCCSSVKGFIKTGYDSGDASCSQEHSLCRPCLYQRRSPPAMIISQLMGTGKLDGYLPSTPQPIWGTKVKAPCECASVWKRQCDNGEDDTHTHKRDKHHRLHPNDLYSKEEYMRVLCVSMASYWSAVVQLGRQRQQAHLIYFSWTEH